MYGHGFPQPSRSHSDLNRKDMVYEPALRCPGSNHQRVSTDERRAKANDDPSCERTPPPLRKNPKRSLLRREKATPSLCRLRICQRHLLWGASVVEADAKEKKVKFALVTHLPGTRPHYPSSLRPRYFWSNSTLSEDGSSIIPVEALVVRPLPTSLQKKTIAKVIGTTRKAVLCEVASDSERS